MIQFKIIQSEAFYQFSIKSVDEIDPFGYQNILIVTVIFW